jgi:hypothetical protein
MGIDAIKNNHVLYVGSDYEQMKRVTQGSQVLTEGNFITDFLFGKPTAVPEEKYDLLVVEGEKGSGDYASNIVMAATVLVDRFSSTPQIILPNEQEVASKYRELDKRIIEMMPESHREFFG